MQTTTTNQGSPDTVISTLNDLIETCKDGEEGFRTCAGNVQDPELKRMLSDRAQSCSEGSKELQDEVRRLGGDPETSSSVTGGLHRAWVNIKGSITGMDETAILNECERGEDIAVQSYRKALDQTLPDQIRAVVKRQYEGVVQNHDLIRDMRNRYRQAS